MKIGRKISLRQQVVLAVCFMAGAGLVIGQPQRLMGKLKGFSITPEFYPAPHSSQMKSFLQGSEAEPLPGGKVRVTDARLKTFREDGVGELQVNTPLCEYETGTKLLTSSGPLDARSVDGRFAMSGVGFAWEQAASRLFISNEVHTVIHSEALNGEGVGEKPTASHSRSNAVSNFDVKAHRFLYEADTGLGTYSEAVKVIGTNLAIAAGELRFKLPMNERRLKTINAEKDVILEYSGIQARGQEADYQTDTGVLRVWGKPSWSFDTREGRAQELVIERTNKTFRANGNAWLKMEGQSLGDYEFLPSGTTNTAGVQTTNQHLEVYSDRYEFHTNYAVFHEKVRVEQFANQEAKGYLTCAQMDVFFSGTNSLDAILAHNEVIISHGENRFTSGEAVYGGTNGLLALTESPAWQSGERSGKGDRIEVNTGKEEMLVRGNAEMRLPAGEMGDIAMLRPSMAKTNKPAAVKPETSRNKMAVITSESYRLSRASAVFSGSVRIDHPQMEMECGNLKIALPQRGKKVDSIVAEEAVRFQFANDEGKTLKGRANKAVYSYTITPSGTNDILELTGYPVLEDGEGRIFRDDVRLLLDVGKGTVLSTGNYHGGIPAKEANTNRFDFPKTK